MFLKLFLTVIILYGVSRFCLSQTDGFSVERISSSSEFHHEWEVPIEDPKIKEIFTQPFDYLGKGAQTYVFASRDGRYVIKFFRYLNKYRSPLEILPFERIQKTVQKRQSRLEKDFRSYIIAHERLKEETGLLFIHLNRTKNLKTTLTLYDKIKVQYKLSLDEMGFILQKRAEPFYPTLTRWIEEENLDEAKGALAKLVQLVLKRCKSGLFDKDPDLATNFGFLDNNPLQIDVGRFKIDETRKDPQIYKQDMARIFNRLEKWLDTHSPELAAYLKHEMDQISY